MWRKQVAFREKKRPCLFYFFEIPSLFIFPYIIPTVVAPVHGYVNAVRQGLQKGQCRTEVKKAVRAAEFIRDHSSGNYNSLFQFGLGQECSCNFHSIGTMCN